MSRPRALVLLLTILALIYMAANQPKPVQTVEVKYCWQPVWNIWGDKIGGKFVTCSELDRYENS